MKPVGAQFSTAHQPATGRALAIECLLEARGGGDRAQYRYRGW
jgi:hypothetical protein